MRKTWVARWFKSSIRVEKNDTSLTGEGGNKTLYGFEVQIAVAEKIVKHLYSRARRKRFDSPNVTKMRKHLGRNLVLVSVNFKFLEGAFLVVSNLNDSVSATPFCKEQQH